MHFPDKLLLEEAARIVEKEGKSVTISATGGSMLPFIRGAQDSVVLTPPKNLRVRDVVLAKEEGGHYLIHRIIAMDSNRVVLMGDGNLSGKEYCRREDVLARVDEVIGPNGRHRRLDSIWARALASLWYLLLPFRRYLLRLCRKWILFLFGGILSFNILYRLFGRIPRLFSEGTLRTVMQGLSPLLVSGLILLLFHFWLIKVENKPEKLSSPGTAVKSAVGGLLIGSIIISIVIGILAAIGAYRAVVCPVGFVYLGYYFLSSWNVAVFEEVIFRGFLFRLLDERFNTMIALTISAFLFGGIHLFNSGGGVFQSVAIALEAGLILGAAYKYSGNIWFPIGIHCAWNYTEGVIFGSSVSGYHFPKSLLTSEFVGPEWLTGGEFGIEASVITVMVGLGLFALFMIKRNNVLYNSRKLKL